MFAQSVYFAYVAVYVLVILVSGSNSELSVRCEANAKHVTSMRKDNLFFKKSTPLVIGHRGNPKLFQENSLSGYKSLRELNVDGFETDIFLTKDKKLVLFHDDNTFKLTGVNNNITEMTYEEIKKLNIKKQLVYGEKVYNYTKTEKIPLLEDLLREMKDSGLLMILEMKPSYYSNHSRETGIEVAKMVKKFGLEKEVVLSSFDPFKLYHARKEFDKLNVCFLVTRKYWDHELFASYVREDLKNLDGLENCVKNLSKSDVGEFVLESAEVVKAIGASSLDMDYLIYNNPKYSNSTFQMFKNNYGPTFSYGAWTVYKMGLSKKELADSEATIDLLIKNRAERLYTDDAPRLLRKLQRPVDAHNSGWRLRSFGFILNPILILIFTFTCNANV